MSYRINVDGTLADIGAALMRELSLDDVSELASVLRELVEIFGGSEEEPAPHVECEQENKGGEGDDLKTFVFVDEANQWETDHRDIDSAVVDAIDGITSSVKMGDYGEDAKMRGSVERVTCYLKSDPDVRRSFVVVVEPAMEEGSQA